MEISFTDKALYDLNFWKQSGNVQLQLMIQNLLKSIMDTPYTGVGKPEMLKYGLSGKWSRRINKEHRIIYEVLNDNVIILSLKGHY